jgi:GMP synthase-like glutamine amidotransferase
LPARPDICLAWLITGSPAAAYEPHPWIPPLEDFLRAARGRAKLVGICFGHQLMAQAFGGRVEKSERGWGAGLQTYRVLEQAAWMDDVAAFAIPVSHQDQVADAPPDARVLAANDFSPFGLLGYEGGDAISFQGHPEFEPAYAKAMIEARRDRLPDPDAHIASLDAPNGRARVAEWIRRFVKSG